MWFQESNPGETVLKAVENIGTMLVHFNSTGTRRVQIVHDHITLEVTSHNAFDDATFPEINEMNGGNDWAAEQGSHITVDHRAVKGGDFLAINPLKVL